MDVAVGLSAGRIASLVPGGDLAGEVGVPVAGVELVQCDSRSALALPGTAAFIRAVALHFRCVG